MRSPKGGSGGAGWPVFAGVGSGSVGLDLLNTEPSMEPWERAGNADSWRAMQPSFGWHITGAGVLRARAPDVRCASRTSTRPSATVAALAATVVGASSRRQPTTMAIATAQTPRSRRTTEATPSSGSRGCAGSRQASRRPRGVSHRTRDPSSESGCDLGCAHALDRRQPARGSGP
jgi:hypothetical protein